MDLVDTKRAMAPLIDQLNHQYINGVEGMGIPTTESLARWVWLRLTSTSPGLVRLEVRQTDSSGCIFAGEG